MESSLEMTAVAPEAPLPGLADLFFSPLATLASLRDRSRVLLPLLIAASYATVVSYYAISRIGLRRLIEASIRATASVDPETLVESAMTHKTEILQMQAAGAFFGTIVTVLGLALLYWLLVTVIGGEATFGRVASVVAHVTFFTTVIKQTMIALAVTITRNPAGFNLKHPLGTNLAFYIHSSSPALAKLMTSFDLLALAGLALLTWGLSRVSDRVSLRAAAAIVLIPWTLYVAVTVAYPALG